MGWGTPLERFESKVDRDRPTECWVWIGGRKAAGYGQFSVGGKKVIAHRWAYQHFVGPIPDGHEVDHLCRNRSCVNPEHLEAIPLRVNRDRRNAEKTHCAHGHEYNEENTAWQTGPDGYRNRYCRICNRLKQQRRRSSRH